MPKIQQNKIQKTTIHEILIILKKSITNTGNAKIHNTTKCQIIKNAPQIIKKYVNAKIHQNTKKYKYTKNAKTITKMPKIPK